MEIKKGIVRDQGYDDVNCTYGITDDGGQYYFIENGELENNKVIASTVLKEAIRHAKDTSLGVIDLDGNVIIPFENKVIKPIDNKFLLVERTTPKDQNVQNSIASRNDPLAATKLVTTAAGLKEKMHKEMGANGKFIFNDQFSEATIYDMDCKNLINNEYYSYIGISDDTLFYCKNTLDSNVNSFSLSKEEKVEDKKEEPVNEANEEVVQEEQEKKLDVLSDSINKEEIAQTIEEKMNEQEQAISTEEVKEENVVEEKENTPIETEHDIFNNAILPTFSKDENNEEVKEEKQQELTNTTEEVENTINNDIFNFEANTQTNNSDNNQEVVSEVEQNNIPIPTATIPDKIVFGNQENTIEEKSNGNQLPEFDIPEAKESQNFKMEEDFVVKDAIIEEVRDTMKDLINQNKEQQETIDTQSNQIATLEDENKELKLTSSDQGRKIDLLETRIRNYEAMISKLEAKNQMLDSKNHMQEKTIAKQEDELNILRPQVEGKKDLVALLADAKTVLNDNNMVDYDFSTYTKSKVT